MNEIQRYLAEEIAIDCSSGQLTRFEASRRLRVMGLSAAVIATLLNAACGADDSSSPPATSVEMNAAEPATPAASLNPAPSATPGAASQTPNTEGNVTPAAPPNAMNAPAPAATPAATPSATPEGPSAPAAALPTQEITFPGQSGVVLRGAWAAAAAPRGAVLVIHENRGLNDHIRSVVGRFAAAGYSALALDLLSEEGGTEALGDVANATAALGNTPPERFVTDMRSALDELARRAPGAAIGAIGFCFGGGMMWRLVASGDPRLVAVAPFYGPLPQGADFTGSGAAVLGVYGALDARVNATQADAEAALTAAGLTHELVTFPGANHAFFNDTGANYDAEAAAAAWTQVLDWFGEYLDPATAG
jgi:carboxymethylenebutenolidase